MLSVYDGVSYKEYVYLNGIKVAVVENGVINYIHNNYLGVPAVITDSSGGVVWEGDYKPFGEMYDVNGTLSNNIRFPGQYKNEESGYSYNYYRDYDPTIGRYLQSDPIGLNGGINTYGYVGGNPVSYTDPFGLTWFRPSNHEYKTGREGHPLVSPGRGIGKFIDDKLPAGHKFAHTHDKIVDKGKDLGIPDAIINIPTMPAAYIYAVGYETINSIFKLFGSDVLEHNDDLLYNEHEMCN